MNGLSHGFFAEPDSWDSFKVWLVSCLNSLDLADIFEVGPQEPPSIENSFTVPSMQAIALPNGRVLLRLSTRPMASPLLRSYETSDVELDTWHDPALFADRSEGWIVSADLELLAESAVVWFRDRNALDLGELGCEHREGVDLPVAPLPAPRPCRSSERGHRGPSYWGGGIGGPEERWAHLIELDGEVIVLRMPDDRIARFRHHDPQRLAAAIERSNGQVAVRPTTEWVGFLAVPGREGHHIFGVAPDTGEPLAPCAAETQD